MQKIHSEPKIISNFFGCTNNILFQLFFRYIAFHSRQIDIIIIDRTSLFLISYYYYEILTFSIFQLNLGIVGFLIHLRTQRYTSMKQQKRLSFKNSKDPC